MGKSGGNRINKKFSSSLPVSSKTATSKHKIAVAAAWRSGSERRFYDDHDRKVNGSTPNLVSLLRPWIRCFTMIISAWWNLASSKLKKSEENSNGKLGNKGNS